MSLLCQISNPHLRAFGGRVIHDFVSCISACLTYVTGYIAGVGTGFRRSITIALTYNAGCMAAYVMIGAAVAAQHVLFRTLLSETALLHFQAYFSITIGFATVMTVVSIILKNRSSRCENRKASSGESNPRKLARGFGIPASFLELSHALVLFPPLSALFFCSLAFGSPIYVLVLPILFGHRTAPSPLLLLRDATEWLISKALLFKEWVSSVRACILVFDFSTTLTAFMAQYP